MAAWVDANRNGPLDALAGWVSLWGGPLALGVAASVAGCLIALRRGLRPALPVLAAWPAAEAAFWSMKLLIDRPRPGVELAVAGADSPAYPSGHAAVAAAVAVALAAAAWRLRRPGPRAGALACLVALPLAVGVSRVVLGVHWTSDVLGGWLVGAAVALLLGAVAQALPSPATTPALPGGQNGHSSKRVHLPSSPSRTIQRSR